MRRRLHITAILTVLGWWLLVEVLNAWIAWRFGEAFIPLVERRDDGTPVKVRSPMGVDLSMVRALTFGCLAIPAAYGLTLSSFIAAMTPASRDEGSPRRRWPWLLASGLLVVVLVRVAMLSAWEAAYSVND